MDKKQIIQTLSMGQEYVNIILYLGFIYFYDFVFLFRLFFLCFSVVLVFPICCCHTYFEFTYILKQVL